MRISILLIVATIAATPWRAHAEPVASDEIRGLMADRHFPEAMQKITANLALKGPAAQSVDRYELFMQKAECHLQMRALSIAIEAYNSAAREATDDRQRTLATANAALLKASKAFTYIPKVAPDKTKPVPIDILDPAHRKQAFLALFIDQLAANDTKIKAAKSAKSLPPIAEVFKPLSEMEGLERMAAGNGLEGGEAAKVQSLRTEVVTQAKKVIADALRAMSKRVGEIDKEAGTFVEFYQDVLDPAYSLPIPKKQKAYRRKGLTDKQTTELQETTVTCDKLTLALIELAKGLVTEDKIFDPFADEAGRVRKEVDRILDVDYQHVYTEIPKK
jgi:hypothetical protein